MKRVYKVVAMISAGALISMGILGCNTFRGMGKDIQRGGQAIENAADRAQ